MIVEDVTVFPGNAVKLIADRVKPAVDDDLFVTKRPLRNSDPNQSVGVFANLWTPDMESVEMRGGPFPRSSEPTLQQYIIGVQAFIKDMDEQRGLNVHSVLAKRVRTMLYRDADLRVGFSSLSSTAGGSTESARRWGVRTQRYISDEIEGSWLYLSTLEFWLETETR